MLKKIEWMISKRRGNERELSTYISLYCNAMWISISLQHPHGLLHQAGHYSVMQRLSIFKLLTLKSKFLVQENVLIRPKYAMPMRSIMQWNTVGILMNCWNWIGRSPSTSWRYLWVRYTTGSSLGKCTPLYPSLSFLCSIPLQGTYSRNWCSVK